MICVYACIYRTCFPSSLLLPQVPVCSVWPRVSVEWSTVEWLNSSGSVFWSSLTYVQRFSFWNSSSICPLIPPAAGWERELGIEWACCAYCEVEIRGGYCWLLSQRTVALTHDRLKPPSSITFHQPKTYFCGCWPLHSRGREGVCIAKDL